jgi:hypothetical protein
MTNAYTRDELQPKILPVMGIVLPHSSSSQEKTGGRRHLRRVIEIDLLTTVDGSAGASASSTRTATPDCGVRRRGLAITQRSLILAQIKERRKKKKKKKLDNHYK